MQDQNKGVENPYDYNQHHQSIDGVESPNTSVQNKYDHDAVNANVNNIDPCSSNGIDNGDTTRLLSTPVKNNNLAVMESADSTLLQQEESNCSNFYDSSNGTRYWIPSVPFDYKPKLNSRFDTWKNAYAFYESYAELAGFSTKLGQSKKYKKTGILTMRYLMCSRGNKSAPTEIDSVDLTEISTSRTTSFKRTDCKAIMKIRIEKHTTQWECNYEVFGDVIAFDATYDTNLYKMIFVPFTSVDHHKKCVTFGVGLLSSETTECYAWLLEKFLEAHGGKQPMLILTDQDPAMKEAVKTVFDNTTHRLCTWHITQKLPLKVCGDVLSNTNLRKEFHKLVWNMYIKPETFEERWKMLMERYKLQDHEWLGKMYAKRRKWVPSYFRDLPMCCLMKTTSRCESSNHLFKVNSSPTNNLVQFLLCFDTTLDGQRYQQRSLEVRTATTMPKFKCESIIERHAATIYTRDVFKDVQNEIKRSEKTCYIAECSKPADGISSFKISHQDVRYDIMNEFTVSFNMNDRTVNCSCMGFKRIGYLCRHAFCVFWHHKVYEIPDRYITQRWTRNVLPSYVFSMGNRYGIDQTKSGILRHRVVDNIQQCVDHLRSNEARLILLDEQVQRIKDEIFNELPVETSSNNKRAVIQELNTINDPQEVELEPPPGIRNKGSGTAKRLRGPGEKAMEVINKPLKNCNYCKQKVRNHDSRNCPKKKADLEELKRLKELQPRQASVKKKNAVRDETPDDSNEDTLDEDYNG
ncbi:hypothetical protein SSX86_010790 [Deinandra increscens subsp. villosa]|uniref:SWIM-type domain-containing protein n=1 Tax=Deinandra increscens subsp. villosa TaxID=3103831 RepID=A0AAP0DFY6_9ASTR